MASFCIPRWLDHPCEQLTHTYAFAVRVWWCMQAAVVLVQATAKSDCKLKQLRLHGCGVADTAFIQTAIQLRAAEALENAKPKKKAKKKRKAAKGKEEAAGIVSCARH